MKKIVKKIFLGFFCFLLAVPAHVLAAGSADFGIQNNHVIFRLKDFTITSESYKVLLFAETEFQQQRAWVCIYNEQYKPEELEENYLGRQGYITNVPFAEKIVVQLFEKNDGIWKECFAPRRSRTNFSDITYTVTVHEEKTEKTDTDDAELYILIDQNHTILPLETAGELYGFHAYAESGSIEIETVDESLDETFWQDPVLFTCTEKNRNGIALQTCEVSLSVHGESETETEVITEAETQEQAEPETQELTETQKSAETDTQESIETETEMTEQGKAESSGLVKVETTEQTETKTQEPTETEEEELAGPKTQELTKTETETETQKLTETETRKLTETETQKLTKTETRKLAETEAQSKAKTLMPVGIILATAVLFLLAGIILLVVRLLKKPMSRSNIKVMPDDNEATITPEEGGSSLGTAFHVQGAVINDKGRVRRNNEDNFYFNGDYMHRDKMDEGAFITEDCQDTVQLYAVCDGMGGTDSGEEASYRAVKELAKRKQNHGSMIDPKELTAVLREISEKINREAMQREQKSGTTIVMMLLAGDRAIFANVGDSRIYRFRNGKLTQVSVDHSKVQRMISMGILTPEQAKKDPGRHVITQYLGMSQDIKVSPYIVLDTNLHDGDVYILCSDGLTDMVEDSRIETILKKEKYNRDAVQELLKEAMNNGGRDNVTIMLIRVKKKI